MPKTRQVALGMWRLSAAVQFLPVEVVGVRIPGETAAPPLWLLAFQARRVPPGIRKQDKTPPIREMERNPGPTTEAVDQFAVDAVNSKLTPTVWPARTTAP